MRPSQSHSSRECRQGIQVEEQFVRSPACRRVDRYRCQGPERHGDLPFHTDSGARARRDRAVPCRSPGSTNLQPSSIDSSTGTSPTLSMYRRIFRISSPPRRLANPGSTLRWSPVHVRATPSSSRCRPPASGRCGSPQRDSPPDCASIPSPGSSREAQSTRALRRSLCQRGTGGESRKRADRGDRRPDCAHSADGVEQLELLGTVGGRRKGAVQCPRLRGQRIQPARMGVYQRGRRLGDQGGSPTPPRNPDGTIITNEKFPDMKALGDNIHALGLNSGIYSSPGPLTCGGYTASHRHEEQDARTYGAMGDGLPEVRLVFLREAGERYLAGGADALHGHAQGPR